MVRKSCRYEIQGLIEENCKKRLKLVIIRIIERPRIKTKKIVKHGRPIYSIGGVIEKRIGIKGKTS